MTLNCIWWWGSSSGDLAVMVLSFIVLYTHMQMHNDAIKTSGHSSLEKYTSHFIERFVYERELETEQRLQHIDPRNSSGYHSFSFPFSWAAQPGGLGAQPLLGHGSHSSIFSPTPTDLNFLSPGLYNNLTPTYFLRASQFALNSTPRQSRSPLISLYLWPDAPVIYTGAFLLLAAWPGWRSICNNCHYSQVNSWSGVIIPVYRSNWSVIWLEYLMPYNCELFTLRIVTWSYNCLSRIIISYLKWYNCANKGLLLSKNNYFKPYSYQY